MTTTLSSLPEATLLAFTMLVPCVAQRLPEPLAVKYEAKESPDTTSVVHI